MSLCKREFKALVFRYFIKVNVQNILFSTTNFLIFWRDKVFDIKNTYTGNCQKGKVQNIWFYHFNMKLKFYDLKLNLTYIILHILSTKIM